MGIEARCCRWILSTHDRVQGDTLPLTDEFLAEMLGVQRSTVSSCRLEASCCVCCWMLACTMSASRPRNSSTDNPAQMRASAPRLSVQ